MTRSNRPLNRIILALLGLLLIAAAAWIANREWPVLALPAIPEPNPTALWIAAAIALVLVVLATLWVVSRGRGRTRALVTRTDDAGVASVDSRVASDFIVEDVKRIADVVGVGSAAFRVRGSVVLELSVTTRPAADVRGVVDAIRRAVRELDEVLEERIPVLLHISSGRGKQQRVR